MLDPTNGANSEISGHKGIPEESLPPMGTNSEISGHKGIPEESLPPIGTNSEISGHKGIPEESLPLVRAMRLSDVDAVQEIERGCFSVPWTRASFVKEITENRCARYLVVEEDGEVIGYAGMWLVIDEAHVTNIAVHPRHRGKGYGERVARALMQLAANLGMTWMTLEVRRSNLVAQSLYRKIGFFDVGYRKRYYDDNREDALIMACESLPKPYREEGVGD